MFQLIRPLCMTKAYSHVATNNVQRFNQISGKLESVSPSVCHTTSLSSKQHALHIKFGALANNRMRNQDGQGSPSLRVVIVYPNMVYINLITSCFYICFTSSISSSLCCTQATPDTSTYGTFNCFTRYQILLQLIHLTSVKMSYVICNITTFNASNLH